MKKRYYPITMRRRLIDEESRQVPVYPIVVEPKKESSKKTSKTD